MEKKGGASKLSLDHIIKERYPTFVDALRDLDDALSLLFLFANLPSTSNVSPKTIALCQRLCFEFEHYLITTNSLRKSFLSIKGIYYQATVQGQDILWLVPYKFVPRVTGDVDFRIMATFVEFYTTLLGFVNFRLYTSIGLVYPPKFNSKSDEQGGELGAFTLEGRAIDEPGQNGGEASANINGDAGEKAVANLANEDIQKQITAIENLSDAQQDGQEAEEEAQEEAINDAIDAFEATGDDADVLPQPQASSNEAASLFAPFTFFLSRETPRQPLEFLLRAFGCKRIGWPAILGDGAFTNNENDPAITHQIVDRPLSAPSPEEQAINATTDPSANQIVKPGHRIPGRTYVQPQWVWDCVNEVRLLRPDLYAPGATLPPHLSPWVKPTKGAYDPTASLAEQEKEGEAEEVEESDQNGAMEEESESDVEDGVPSATSKGPPLDAEMDPHGMDIAGSESDSASASSAASVASSFGGFDDAAASSESETETARNQHQLELEAEAAGVTFSESNSVTKANGTPIKGILKPSKGEEARKKAAKKTREEEEELERRKMMMGRKKRKLVEKMLYSNKTKDDEAEKLRAKRRRLEAGRP